MYMDRIPSSRDVSRLRNAKMIMDDHHYQQNQAYIPVESHMMLFCVALLRT
jgi:hypothetical protein